MKQSPKLVEGKIQRVVTAWETVRPEKLFAGMSLEQFRTRIQPSVEARQKVDRLEDQFEAAKASRDAADVASLVTMNFIVNAVKGDPQEGEDGELYAAMGYVRKSERRSGLTRGRRTEAKSAAATSALAMAH